MFYLIDYSKEDDHQDDKGPFLLLFNPFLSFTFLEELSIMEDKLFGLFGLRIGQL